MTRADVRRRLPEAEGIGAGPVGERVFAGSATEQFVTGKTVESVVAALAVDRVIGGVETRDRIGAVVEEGDGVGVPDLPHGRFCVHDVEAVATPGVPIEQDVAEASRQVVQASLVFV